MSPLSPTSGNLVSYCVLDAKGHYNPQTAQMVQAYDSLKDAVEHGRKLEGSVIAVIDIDGHIERFIDPSV